MKFLRFLTLLCLSLIIAACGGGGGGDSGSSGYGPTASAGVSRSVAMGDTVTLDGSASKTGSSGGALTYAWTLISKPVSSNAGLSSATVVNPSFVADVAGSYEVRLVVNDGSLGSEAVTVTITATNPEPVAIAETEQNVLIGSTVVLDGSGSVPPTGGSAASLQYQWTLTSRPADSVAALSNATAASPTFYADVAGTYEATLVVSYQDKVSDALKVTVTAAAGNSIPVAVAKIKSVGGSAVSPTNTAAPYEYTIERDKAVVLDASESTDADGNKLSYRWYFFSPGSGSPGVSIPTCSKLSTKLVFDGPNPTFTPDAVGNWTVRLLAFDGTSLSSETSLVLKVTKPANAANTPPAAAFLFEDDSYELELGKVAYRSGSDATCDIDGDSPLKRSYQWISTPAGYTQTDLSQATSFSLNPNVPGDYTVKMTVDDGNGGISTKQATFTARTGANVRPAADAVVDAKTLMVGSTVWFDGSGSSDANGDKLSYSWTLLDRPDGSSATLQNTTSVRASLVTDVPGSYIARLEVTDSLGATSRHNLVAHSIVQVKNQNNPPTADQVRTAYEATYIAFWANSNNITSNLGSDEQPFIAGNSIAVRPGSVVDPDNDPLYYLWTLQQPAGSSLVDSHTTIGMGRTPLVAGIYTVTFVASDGVESSAPLSLAFKVVQEADYPTLLLKAHGLTSSRTPTPTAWPYANEDRTYTSGPYYTLVAYGGDYTITDLKTTSATDGVAAPTFSGLANGQVIKKGESVPFSLVPPAGLSALQTRDVTWTFGIKEKPGYTFTYRMLNRD